jgi:putrescine transport system permease protein
MVGKMLWTEFFGNKDWPLASAVAICLLALLVVPFVAMQRLEQRMGGDEL